jgi:hypothetical protein
VLGLDNRKIRYAKPVFRIGPAAEAHATVWQSDHFGAFKWSRAQWSKYKRKTVGAPVLADVSIRSAKRRTRNPARRR